MSGTPVSSITSSPVLVGRAPQLSFLQRALEGVRAGKGATVLISGEAGIGKSRLARETQQLAAKQGFVFLRGRCFEQDRTLPYARGLISCANRILERRRIGLEPEHRGRTRP